MVLALPRQALLAQRLQGGVGEAAVGGHEETPRRVGGSAGRRQVRACREGLRLPGPRSRPRERQGCGPRRSRPLRRRGRSGRQPSLCGHPWLLGVCVDSRRSSGLKCLRDGHGLRRGARQAAAAAALCGGGGRGGLVEPAFGPLQRCLRLMRRREACGSPVPCNARLRGGTAHMSRCSRPCPNCLLRRSSVTALTCRSTEPAQQPGSIDPPTNLAGGARRREATA